MSMSPLDILDKPFPVVAFPVVVVKKCWSGTGAFLEDIVPCTIAEWSSIQAEDKATLLYYRDFPLSNCRKL